MGNNPSHNTVIFIGCLLATAHSEANEYQFELNARYTETDSDTGKDYVIWAPPSSGDEDIVSIGLTLRF